VYGPKVILKMEAPLQTTVDNIEKLIVEMLRKKQGLGEEIGPEDYNRDIKDTFRIDGADAYEFLVEYKNKFNVDMTAFIFKRYFSKEGLWPWELFHLLLGRKGKSSPLSIRQLADIARAGRWPNEV
jgi:hypothetical protein